MTPTDPKPPHCRWMIRRDLPAVLAIERTTAAPWAEADFLHCLRQRNCIGMVLERDDDILGYMVYTLHKAFLAVENFAVRADERRAGLGSIMGRKLIAKLKSHRRYWLAVTVRETNAAVVWFFRALGFRAVGLSRGIYADTGEDGFRMEYREDEPEPVEVVNRILKFDPAAPSRGPR